VAPRVWLLEETMRIRWLSLAVIFGCAMAAAAQSGPKDVAFQAPDGIALQGTFHPARKPGPGIMLFHQCNRDRKTWADLATKLSAEGFHVLAMDNRGFGESGGDRFDKLPPERQAEEVRKWPGDFDLAFAYLLAQPGVDKERIGAAGASCGVNNAIQLALRHPEVKTLVLLSGSTDDAGRKYLQNSPGLPVFAAASDDDFELVPIMRWLLAFSHNPRNKFVEYKAAGHGALMFAVEKGLLPLIEEWFGRTLGSTPPYSPAGLAPAKPSAIEEFWDTLTQPGGIARARQLYNAAKKRDSKVFLFPESQVNLLGYQRLQAGGVPEAIEIFKLNAEAYPNSANVYDSLVDAYLAAGDRDLAMEFSEKALEALKTHPPQDGPTAEAIRKSAEDKLKKLRGGT
jgi:dienelactone hydrolase